MSTSTDVLIIGGGIVGAATAYHLSRRGAKVILLESDRLASGATGRNLGYIWLHTRRKGPELDLAMATRNELDGLPEELGADFGLRTGGGLIYYKTEAQGVVMREFVEARIADGVPMQLLDGDQAREIAPILPDTVLGASYLPARRAGRPDALRPGLRGRGPAPWRARRRGRLGARVRDGRWPDHAGADRHRAHLRGQGRAGGRRLEPVVRGPAGAGPPDPGDAAAGRPDRTDAAPPRRPPVRPGGREAVRDLPGAPVVPARAVRDGPRGAPGPRPPRIGLPDGRWVVPARDRDGLHRVRLAAGPRRRVARSARAWPPRSRNSPPPGSPGPGPGSCR